MCLRVLCVCVSVRVKKRKCIERIEEGDAKSSEVVDSSPARLCACMHLCVYIVEDRCVCVCSVRVYVAC